MRPRIPYASAARTLVLSASAALAAVAPWARADEPDPAQSKPVGRWQDASLEDYRNHLAGLQGLTKVCAKGRNVQSCGQSSYGPCAL